MIEINKLVFLVALVFILSSCNMSDSTETIFGNYVLSTESRNSHTIVGGTNYIPPDVIAYEFDKKFLVVKQRPDLDFLVVKKANELWDMYEDGNLSPNDSIYLLFKQYSAQENRYENFKIAMSVAKVILDQEDSIYNKYIDNPKLYWILIRSVDSLIGPLNQEEFEKAQNVLAIPDNLKLN